MGRSKAEKVFRPWWDEVEDTLLNTLVILGKNFNVSYVQYEPLNVITLGQSYRIITITNDFYLMIVSKWDLEK